MSDNDSDYILDAIFVKGVSHIREENDCNYDYELIKNSQSAGFRVYMHRYFLELSDYYNYYQIEKQVKRVKEIRQEMKKIDSENEKLLAKKGEVKSVDRVEDDPEDPANHAGFQKDFKMFDKPYEEKDKGTYSDKFTLLS